HSYYLSLHDALPISHGPGEQAQHNLKWRIGARLNLDPDITNDPRYMNPLQSRNALSNGPYSANGRTFNNPHTWADRGLYPEYEQDRKSTRLNSSHVK